MKLPNIEWSWLIQHRRGYNTVSRGDMIKKFNIKHVQCYEPGQYDLAILHLDQQCLTDELWKRGKGSLFRDLNEVIQDIPKVLIMHGTPYYPEVFSNDITKENYQELGFTENQIGCSSVLINKVKDIVEKNNITMVVNSYRAKEQWGIGTTIIHGMDPDEWYDLPKEPRVVTMISPGGLDMYYDRTFLREVREELSDRDITHCHITVDEQFRSWEEYKTFLGRSLIYFNPTRESPMPRARTEAMFSGCCVITTPHQDADKFIENGKNGFIIPRNPKTVANLVEGLIYDYKTAISIGKVGNETAMKFFHKDRYIKEWTDLISSLIK